MSIAPTAQALCCSVMSNIGAAIVEAAMSARPFIIGTSSIQSLLQRSKRKCLFWSLPRQSSLPSSSQLCCRYNEARAQSILSCSRQDRPAAARQGKWATRCPFQTAQTRTKTGGMGKGTPCLPATGAAYGRKLFRDCTAISIAESLCAGFRNRLPLESVAKWISSPARFGKQASRPTPTYRASTAASTNAFR